MRERTYISLEPELFMKTIVYSIQMGEFRLNQIHYQYPLNIFLFLFLNTFSLDVSRFNSNKNNQETLRVWLVCYIHKCES